MEGRTAEITVDLVLQARAKMSDEKVNGPDDAIVREMIKQLPLEKVYSSARCFQMGLMESSSSWKIVNLVFLRNSDAAPKTGDQKLQCNCADISDIEVLCILYYSSLGKGKAAGDLE